MGKKENSHISMQILNGNKSSQNDRHLNHEFGTGMTKDSTNSVIDNEKLK